MPRLLKRTTYQVNEQEAHWSGFLSDFKIGSTRWPFDAPLDSRTTDPRSIVREAWSSCRTIITSRGAEFVECIEEFQYPASNRECKDLWGLIVIPDNLLQSEIFLQNISQGLTLLAKERLQWPAAAFLNLNIEFTPEGTPEIRRFKRCHFCDASISINPPWHAWYESLPMLQPSSNVRMLVAAAANS
jgi:hypothetical protein